MNPLAINVHPRAEEDLENAFMYFSRRAGISMAEKFDDAVGRTLSLLAEQPELGATATFRSRGLADVRRWAVPEFRSYLIFYRLTERSIEVLRVLHGARDLEPLLLEE